MLEVGRAVSKFASIPPPTTELGPSRAFRKKSIKRGGIDRKSKYTQMGSLVMIADKLLSHPHHVGSWQRVLRRKTTLWAGKEAEPRLASKFKAPPSEGFQPTALSIMGGWIEMEHAGVKEEEL